MRPDRKDCAASISHGGLGILPIGSVGIATIGALPESVRRCQGRGSSTRSVINAGNHVSSPGQVSSLTWSARAPGTMMRTHGTVLNHTHLRRSMLDFLK